MVFDKKVRISAGTSVDYVLKKGTEPQKATVKMFDLNQNGKISIKESRNYKKYIVDNFLREENVVQVLKKDGGESYFFRYNKISDLDNFAIKEGALYLRNEQEFVKGLAIIYDASTKKLSTYINGLDSVRYLNTEI